MFEDFDNNEEITEKNEDLGDLNELAAPLEEIIEPEYNYEEDNEKQEEEHSETELKEIEKTDKKRFKRLNKLGAKGIVKAIDIGNANLCRKISFSSSSEEFRADKEAIEDLTEVIEEILPNKAGKTLKIPLWLQLLIFILLAFAPGIISAFADRSENRLLKEQKEALKKIKKEKKVLKKKLEKMRLEAELKEAMNKEPSEEEKMEILTGSENEEEPED